jgi:hypothetical protein
MPIRSAHALSDDELVGHILRQHPSLTSKMFIEISAAFGCDLDPSPELRRRPKNENGIVSFFRVVIKLGSLTWVFVRAPPSLRERSPTPPTDPVPALTGLLRPESSDRTRSSL